MKCPYCQSEKTVKKGKDYHRDGKAIQNYLCKGCGKRFNERTGTSISRLISSKSIVSAHKMRPEKMGIRTSGKVLEKSVMRHQVMIAGKVINAKTQQAIAGVQITLSEMPDKYRLILKLKAMQYDVRSWEKIRPDRTYSDQDGYYFFRDLPTGNYRLEAFLPHTGTRYSSASKTVTIAEASETSGVIHIDLFLSPTGVQGKITAPENEKFIAKVQIQGQNTYALTNGDGEYILTGVEASQQEVILVISASGYELNLSPDLYPPKISLLQGQVLTEQNFQLKRKSVTNGVSLSANRSPP